MAKLTATISLMMLITIIYLNKFNDQDLTNKSECVNSYKPCEASEEIKYLSRALNEALKQIGRLSCNSSTDNVSSHGGWCKNISGINSTFHQTDFNLAAEFSEFLKGKHVASFGDGPGEYQAFISTLDQVQTYDAFDGAPFVDETTDGHVKHLDLSVPVYHLPLYDWVISLEVAEHIPKKFEQIFIDNLTRHAKEGIILSWSVVGQGGHGHVNNQNFQYVKEQLEKRGFKVDKESTKRFKKASSLHWLRRNLHVYIR